jgi:hypothetical protein
VYFGVRAPLWQTFVGETLYSGYISYYAPAVSNVVYRWGPSTDNVVREVPEEDLPRNNLVSASGGMLDGKPFIALNQVLSTSSTGPTGLLCALWSFNDRKIQYALGVTMLCLSPQGNAIAARTAPNGAPNGRSILTNGGGKFGKIVFEGHPYCPIDDLSKLFLDRTLTQCFCPNCRFQQKRKEIQNHRKAIGYGNYWN